MKNKLILIPIFLFVGLLTVGAKLVLAAVTTLPRVTTACETKVGGLLMGIDDGFSSLKSCPGNSRKVVLGEVATSTGGGSNIGTGYVLFSGYKYLLSNDKKVWSYELGSTDEGGVTTPDGWKNNLPNIPVEVSTVIQWNGDAGYPSFLTTSGNYYIYMGNSDGSDFKWRNLQNPNNPPVNTN